MTIKNKFKGYFNKFFQKHNCNDHLLCYGFKVVDKKDGVNICKEITRCQICHKVFYPN